MCVLVFLVWIDVCVLHYVKSIKMDPIVTSDQPLCQHVCGEFWRVPQQENHIIRTATACGGIAYQAGVITLPIHAKDMIMVCKTCSVQLMMLNIMQLIVFCYSVRALIAFTINECFGITVPTFTHSTMSDC